MDEVKQYYAFSEWLRDSMIKNTKANRIKYFDQYQEEMEINEFEGDPSHLAYYEEGI